MIKNIVVNKPTTSSEKHLIICAQNTMLKGFKSGLKTLQKNSLQATYDAKLMNFHNATSFMTKL